MEINKINSNQDLKRNSKKDKALGVASIVAGGYLGEKAVTSGLRRALGVRIETHTTNSKAAKDIIKAGKQLDPNYGGAGCARVMGIFSENSKKYVHITGLHKNWKDALSNNKLIDAQLMSESGNKMAKFIDSPLGGFFRAPLRKVQQFTYRLFSLFDIKNQDESLQTLENGIQTKDKIFKALIGKGTKTFYIGGSDEYFNKNFIPDTDDFALKSEKAVKVATTKLGATFDALKRDGLSGVKQNKGRVAAGIAICVALGYASYKLIKNGIEKIKHKENK